ncbi:hypothetical protein M8J76_015672 [Diaphorina citri]|nr:hypothetical protein M8J76_015672 [Diaphorina citri]
MAAPSFKLAANLTLLFNDLAANYLDKYRVAAELGFRYIESWFPPVGVTLEQLVAAQTRHGLKQVLINTEVDENFGYAVVKGKESEFRASLEKTIQYACALNIPAIHIMSGKTESSRTQPIASEDPYTTLKENLIYACAELERHSLTALIEPVNQHSVPGYYLSSFRVAERLIRELRAHGISNVQLQFDFFNAQRICGDLTHTFGACRDLIGHVQIAQAPDRQEPHARGEIDYAYVFELLAREGYEGYVGLEYKPQGNTKEGLEEFLKTFDLKL